VPRNWWGQDASSSQKTADELVSSARSTIGKGLDKPPADDAMKHWENNISKFSSIDQAQQDIDLKNKLIRTNFQSNNNGLMLILQVVKLNVGLDSKIG